MNDDKKANVCALRSAIARAFDECNKVFDVKRSMTDMASDDAFADIESAAADSYHAAKVVSDKAEILIESMAELIHDAERSQQFSISNLALVKKIKKYDDARNK